MFQSAQVARFDAPVCSIVSAAAPRIDKASRTLENRRFSLLKDKAFQ
jgi:hypothetical protein